MARLGWVLESHGLLTTNQNVSFPPSRGRSIEANLTQVILQKHTILKSIIRKITHYGE